MAQLRLYASLAEFRNAALPREGMVAAMSLRDAGFQLLGAAARRATVVRGRSRLAHAVQARMHHTDIPYRDSCGLSRRVDLADVIDAQWFFGVNVGLPTDVLRRVLGGAVAVDAGANVGVVTGQLCRAVGSGGLVIAVEPLPANLRKLDELQSLNVLPMLRIERVALSDQNGTADLRVMTSAEESSAYASFTASWVDGSVISVPTRTLDDIRNTLDRPVDFLKIDVEGAEQLVLRGATAVLAKDRPLVFCEFNDAVLRDAGSSSASLLEAFEDHGYRVCGGDDPTALEGRVANLLLEVPRKGVRAF